MFRKSGVPESLHAIRSAISLTKLDNPESYEYYKKHFGVDPQW